MTDYIKSFLRQKAAILDKSDYAVRVTIEETVNLIDSADRENASKDLWDYFHQLRCEYLVRQRSLGIMKTMKRDGHAFLPLVRTTNQEPKFGLLYDGFGCLDAEDCRVVVFHCRMGEISHPTEEEFRRDCPRKAYSSFEDVLDDGWLVD